MTGQGLPERGTPSTPYVQKEIMTYLVNEEPFGYIKELADVYPVEGKTHSKRFGELTDTVLDIYNQMKSEGVDSPKFKSMYEVTKYASATTTNQY